MPTTSHDARLTYHDFVLLPGDGRRHEIIGGVHYVTPSPNTKQSFVPLPPRPKCAPPPPESLTEQPPLPPAVALPQAD